MLNSAAGRGHTLNTKDLVDSLPFPNTCKATSSSSLSVDASLCISLWIWKPSEKNKPPSPSLPFYLWTLHLLSASASFIFFALQQNLWKDLSTLHFKCASSSLLRPSPIGLRWSTEIDSSRLSTLPYPQDSPLCLIPDTFHTFSLLKHSSLPEQSTGFSLHLRPRCSSLPTTSPCPRKAAVSQSPLLRFHSFLPIIIPNVQIFLNFSHLECRENNVCMLR